MAHTKAPWEFVLHDDGYSSDATFEIRMGSRLGGKNGWEPQHRIDYEVSDEESCPDQFAEAEANARLIVAAPDLIDALKAAIGYLTNARIDLETGAPKATAIATINGGLDVVRAAINKAEAQ